MKVRIVNPVDNTLVSVEDWKKVENPTIATLVAIVSEDEKRGFYLAKDTLPGTHTFDEAQEIAATYRNTIAGVFRNPTRKEALDIYDARFVGLDEAIELVGGTPIFNCYCWTCEADPDPEYTSRGAFLYFGGSGAMYLSSKYYGHSVRPLSAFIIE